MKRLNRWLLLMVMTVITSVAFAASSKMTCTLTGKEVQSCCCEMRPNGKMFCKLAKKEVDSCCCEGM